MRLAYITTYRTGDVSKWSGSGYFIHRALQQSGLSTVIIDNLRNRRLPISVGKKIFYRIRGQQYLVDRDPALLRGYARQAEHRLANIDFDLIFSPGTIPVAYLQSDRPIVFWTDATFSGMRDFYPAFSRLCPATLTAAEAAEQSALNLCQLAIYTSQWAADSALEHYQVSPDKVMVVPFGANLEPELHESEVESVVGRRWQHKDRPMLLFIGIDWHRKGGEVALATTRELRRRGLDATLVVVGCRPPLSELPPWVKVCGYLEKETDAGTAALTSLLTTAHFLILPSKAECYGLVIAEASAFALPSLGFDVGGVSSVLNDRVNGRLFPLGSDFREYADFITETLFDGNQYQSLCRSSFRLYRERLNWRTAGLEVRGILENRFESGI